MDRKALVYLLVLPALNQGLAEADTFLDDFDGGISQEHWVSFNTADHWTVTAPDESGRLEISKPADDDQSTANLSIPAGIRSALLLDGDFDVSVSFELLVFPPGGLGLNEILLDVRGFNAGPSFAVLRAVTGNGTQIAEGWTDLPIPEPVGMVEDGTMTGRFQVTREGQRMSAFIDRGSGSELLGSVTDPGFQGPVEVSVWATQLYHLYSGVRSFSAVDVRFDNFAATADTIIPEPATLSLLALGGLALMRRRRRWASPTA